MCGIFALLQTDKDPLAPLDCWQMIEALFKASSRRGQDCSGLSVYDGKTAERFVSNGAYTQFLNNALKQQLNERLQGRTSPAVLGQTRMITNGDSSEQNIQPLTSTRSILAHNGIVTNEADLRADFDLQLADNIVDSRTIQLALDRVRAEEPKKQLSELTAFFNAVKGANNFIYVDQDSRETIFTTSHGSLYFLHLDGRLTVIASEERILKAIATRPEFDGLAIEKAVPGHVYHLDKALSLSSAKPAKRERMQSGNIVSLVPSAHRHITKHIADLDRLVEEIPRCQKCLLPETVPFIEFDAGGVCNFCHHFGEDTLRNRYKPEALKERLKPAQGRASRKILFPLSGGRDSSFGLHYLSQFEDLEIITYTYDWGMVTDLARRNISRMCGALQLEHILVAADINQKLANIRKNVKAWLARPHLGIVPLFMAGDKQYFHYMNKVQDEIEAEDILLCSNPYEKTDFKTGFCGVNPFARKAYHYWGLDLKSQAGMLAFYGTQFLGNPRYLNSSLIDTAGAYISYYLAPKRFTMLFDYIPWVETDVEEVITSQYGWEMATDTVSSWRIGDGTAPFYNYIYLGLAGFTENDTLRSNQVRTGQLSRDAAFEKLKTDNQLRGESLIWYFERIGLDPLEAIQQIERHRTNSKWLGTHHG